MATSSNLVDFFKIPAVRNALGVIFGLLLGGQINMALIMASSKVIPLPAGINPQNIQSLKAGIHLMQPIHFLMPFLAHALGTLVGAFIAAKLAKSAHKKMALIVGAISLLGGIAAVFMIPAPVWFSAVDLLLAYIPMAYLGWWMAERI
jgi:uncharacterized membrane protein required for colicin V production